MYKQCLLKKRTGNVQILDVCWIPEEFAIVGKVLKFWKDRESNEDGTYGKWDDGWVVIKVYGIRSEKDLIKMTWDYRKWDWIEVE